MSSLNRSKFTEIWSNIKNALIDFFAYTEEYEDKAQEAKSYSKAKSLNKLKSILINGILYILSPFIALIIVLVIILSRVIKFTYKWIFYTVTAFRSVLVIIGNNRQTDINSLDKAIETTGFLYDQEKDIFYSKMNPWQRKYGYCRLYDEIAAPMGMIVDSEPVYFKYGGKKWLIEFWKGQYDLTTGCEIGIYTTEGPSFNIPNVFNGTFYESANNDERLRMAFTLKKNGKTLFTREEKHWWLTGFKLGEFSKPSELSMNIEITFKDEIMRNAFLKGLKSIGYKDSDILKLGLTVYFKYGKPKVKQAHSRTRFTDWLIQKKNKYMCKKFQKITGSSNTMPEKLAVIQEKAPNLYSKIINIGKTQKLYEKLIKINNYFG